MYQDIKSLSFRVNLLKERVVYYQLYLNGKLSYELSSAEYSLKTT